MNRENEMIEFKRTTGEINEAMISISAILNKHRHGQLYFGLRNDGTPFRFDINDSTLRDVSRKIYESIRPQIFPIVETDTVDGVEVIRVDFEGNDIPYSAFGKYYIRVADEDRELPPAELRKLMIGKEYEDNWEDILTDETVDDVDDAILRRFFDLAVGCGRMPYADYDKEALLEKLNVMRKGKLTRAGRVLFSKNAPVVLKMAVFATEHKETFLDIRRLEGNVFSLIDEAMDYIVKNIRWRVELGKDGIHREEIPEIPIAALREAIVNSFAHARYDLAVQHEIDVYSDRIAVINPGSFANSYEPIDFYHRDIQSFLRNETIAHVMYLCKDVETFGSGLRKIYSLCEKQNTAVSYHNEENSFSLEFARVDRNKVPNGTLNGTIKEPEDQVMSIMKNKPDVTVNEMIVLTGRSERTLKRILADLKEKGLIERIGSRKKGYWKVL